MVRFPAGASPPRVGCGGCGAGETETIKPDMKTCYKLVASIDGYWSITGRCFGRPVRYEIDRPTNAPWAHGPLCAFATVHDAAAFVLGTSCDSGILDLAHGLTAILECEFEAWDGALIASRNGPVAVWDSMKPGRTIDELPAGTILCKTITPRQVVPFEEIAGLFEPAVWVFDFGRPSVHPALTVCTTQGYKIAHLLEPFMVLQELPADSRLRATIETAMAIARAAAAVVERAETSTT